VDQVSVSERGNDAVRHYLQDLVAAEQSFEGQFRAFSQEGDDDEVQAVFASHAEETRRHAERLKERLARLGGEASAAKGFWARVLESAPKLAQPGHVTEERTVQNLISAFALENSECAMYEALAVVARAAGDAATESLAREQQAASAQVAQRVWRFITSRSKIAYNVLTAGEIDPAIETRAPENRVV
jgi:ferritin-like metal-binding protein YciE